MKFTEHKINYFKVSNSGAFKKFTVLSSHHLSLAPKRSITPNPKAEPIKKLLPIGQPLATTNLDSVSPDQPVLDISYQ